MEERHRLVTARIRKPHPMSMFFDAESSEDTAQGAVAPRKRRMWLPLILASAALVVVGSLVAGALYVFSIDRAVNQNLQRGAKQLPDETPTAEGEEPRPPKTDG